MKSRSGKHLRFTPQHAAHVLHVLIADGKLVASDVAAALKRREQMIRELRQKLVAFERGEIAEITRKAVTRKVGRKKPKLSAATRAKYRQQGRYMAAVRRLSKASRVKIKSIREKSGVRAAITAAKRMAK